MPTNTQATNAVNAMQLNGNTQNHKPMTAKERILHAILFEMGAIAISVGIIGLFGVADISSATGVSIIMAVMAMAWNVVFNWGFDKVFVGERLHRGVRVRILHVVLFEGGLLILTIPVIAYMLGVSLWQAFVMDVGLSLTITVYAFFYNWLYDYIRYWWFYRCVN